MINLNAVKTLLKKNEKIRPILTCISYQDDKIVFTDSYSLVEIKIQNKQTFNLDMITGRLLELEYPNIDSVKPQEYYLESVDNKYITTKNDIELYMINDYPFDRKQVEQTFKTVNIDFNKHVKLNQLKIHKRNNHAMLIYNHDDIYILVIGLLKETEIDDELGGDN